MEPDNEGLAAALVEEVKNPIVEILRSLTSEERIQIMVELINQGYDI